MDAGYLIFLAVAFVAVVLGIEGLYLLWNDRHSPQARQLQRRLRALKTARAEAESKLLKDDRSETDDTLDRLTQKLPKLASLQDLLRQSGSDLTAGRFVLLSCALALTAGMVATLIRLPLVLTLLLIIAALLLPAGWLLRARTSRLAQIEKQLPDAVEMIARALRAGHALTPSLQMVGEEMPEPIAGEFRATSDEIAFGASLPDALMDLARRVPVEDLRFFVIAVILQRETGGNLAEILDNIGRLIRERFKLLGTVRVLSAEGRLSGWILAALAPGTALMMQLVKPGFLNLLWTDALGFKLLVSVVVLTVLGMLWMWRLVRIRV
ncbi:MAG TPA: type II secretion system F family protein [Burkholderiaceae bacterium]|nr:type II secretion system F family protein [Burkholderiaceae bacterium]